MAGLLVALANTRYSDSKKHAVGICCGHALVLPKYACISRGSYVPANLCVCGMAPMHHSKIGDKRIRPKPS